MSVTVTPLVETRALTLRVASRDGPDQAARVLVERLDWCCMAGERWCVIGRNAVGKTTLLRALAGLPGAPYAGEVLWQGRESGSWSAADAAASRAFMPQQTTDRFALSVRRLVALSNAGTLRHDQARVFAALGIEALIDRDVMRLSGGERQRVALAQCVLQGAPLMLMDEPAAFQDPAHQTALVRWFIDVSRHDDLGFVITAHDVNWLARVATHVLALHGDGRWSAGPVAAMLAVDVLEEVYGCSWTKVGGEPDPVFVPAFNAAP